MDDIDPGVSTGMPRPEGPPLRSALTVFFLIVCFGLAIRWGLLAHHPFEARFHPQPDALEYAAAAQALAHEGRHVLHVGPAVVRPRYAPGWPLILAIPVKLGIPGERLWYVTGLFSAVHAGLVSVIAFLATRFCLMSLPGDGSRRSAHGPVLAAAVAGVGWCLTPVSLVWSRVVMSDEPAALFANGAIALSAAGLLRRTGESDDSTLKGLCVAAGAAAALASAIRPVSAVLLLAPLTAFGIGHVATRGWSSLMRRLAWCAAGTSPVLALVWLILLRSGSLPWQWSGYDFWLPAAYGQISNVFHPRHALVASPDYAAHTGGVALTHLRIATNLFLGIRVPGQAGLGALWPLLAWVLGALMLAAVCRGARGATIKPAALAAGIAGWILCHVVVFSMYFFPGTRFYLAALPWIWVLFGASVGVLWQRLPHSMRPVVLLLAASAVYSVGSAARPLLRPQKMTSTNEPSRQAFALWLSDPPAVRRESTFPLNPVEAQALGLLTPEAIRQIEDSAGAAGWGRMPSTEHVERLRAMGFALR